MHYNENVCKNAILHVHVLYMYMYCMYAVILYDLMQYYITHQKFI